MITMCTQQKPATNSRKDRQRSALILNTGHSKRAYCCPKCGFEMACLSLRLSSDMYFPVNCNEECSLLVSHKRIFLHWLQLVTHFGITCLPIWDHYMNLRWKYLLLLHIWMTVRCLSRGCAKLNAMYDRQRGYTILCLQLQNSIHQ